MEKLSSHTSLYTHVFQNKKRKYAEILKINPYKFVEEIILEDNFDEPPGSLTPPVEKALNYLKLHLLIKITQNLPLLKIPI